MAYTDFTLEMVETELGVGQRYAAIFPTRRYINQVGAVLAALLAAVE